MALVTARAPATPLGWTPHQNDPARAGASLCLNRFGFRVPRQLNLDHHAALFEGPSTPWIPSGYHGLS